MTETPTPKPTPAPLFRKQRHQAPQGECSYCDREREAGNSFHPPHDASPRCRSGKRNHCSCDTCF